MNFHDVYEIKLKNGIMESIDEYLLNWGKNYLKNYVKSHHYVDIIKKIHNDFHFSSSRPNSIQEFIIQKSGNCYVHARLCTFLLRLAGYSTKFVHDIHIRYTKKVDNIDDLILELTTGWFSPFHNDHIWILAYDQKSSKWIPLDSTLGISSFEEFIKIRSKGIRFDDMIDFGLPFVFLEDNGMGVSNLQNNTRNFIRELANFDQTIDETWLKFTEFFYNLKMEDLEKPFSKKILNEIQSQSIKQFKDYFLE